MVNDKLQTSDPRIYAIGEAALHRGMVYGLIAPGWEMAETAARRFAGEDSLFTGADLSTKLKLMGVDVASFGDYAAPQDRAVPLTYEDPFSGAYKKLLFSPDGSKLLGGVLVGDAADYATLAALAKSGEPLAVEPADLIGVAGGGAPTGETGLGEAAQVCSCNNVAKGEICRAIREQGLSTLGEVKQETAAGTGCGGCVPLVTGLLNAELAAAGRSVNKNLCEHFAYTRQELLDIVKVKRIETFDELIANYGQGRGCEVCKPAASSIFASLWNESITKSGRLAPERRAARPHQAVERQDIRGGETQRRRQAGAQAELGARRQRRRFSGRRRRGRQVRRYPDRRL